VDITPGSASPGIIRQKTSNPLKVRESWNKQIDKANARGKIIKTEPDT